MNSLRETLDNGVMMPKAIYHTPCFKVAHKVKVMKQG
jgi:hypothetical protein